MELMYEPLLTLLPRGKELSHHLVDASDPSLSFAWLVQLMSSNQQSYSTIVGQEKSMVRAWTRVMGSWGGEIVCLFSRYSNKQTGAKKKIDVCIYINTTADVDATHGLSIFSPYKVIYDRSHL